MSDLRAVATVVAALEQLIQTAANKAVGQANVTFGPPRAPSDDEPAVNICLFRVAPNPALRNVELPTRNSAGQLTRPARLALDLHFLLSFYGDASTFQPELLLAAVALALEEEPILSKSAIAAAITAHATELGGADLGDAPSTVKISLETISLDDFTKIWSVFFQVPYVLSAAYLCSHVIVESEARPPPPLPVARPNLFVSPLLQLSLDSAGSAPRRSGGITWNGPLWLSGKGLARSGLRFFVDGTEVPLAPGDNTDSAVQLSLVPENFGGAQLAAGTHAVQARAPAESGKPAYLQPRSNLLPFAIHPAITLAGDAVNVTGSAGTRRTGTVAIEFSPTVRAAQKVTLALDARDPEKPGGVLLARAAPAPDSAPVATIVFSFSELEAGTYLVRADIDGVPSLPLLGTDPADADFGLIVGPEMVLP